ncbi:MAG: hypothetical protein GJ671_00780 [Alteromonadaceae bacterium]|nr:hypothetical protein [Alteromonadaceae bacterium]
MRVAIHIYLIIALALQAGLGGLFAAQKLDSINATLGDDVLVICTGTQLKYIDAIEYYGSGNIVEIQNPTDSPNDTDPNASNCIVFQAQDIQASLFLMAQQWVISTVSSVQQSIKPPIFSVVRSRFLLPILRAPPAFL